MSKYSKAIKRQGWGYRSIAQKLSISKSTIERCVFLGKQGISLDKKMTHKSFSARFKAHVIETRWENKLSLVKQLSYLIWIIHLLSLLGKSAI